MAFPELPLISITFTSARSQDSEDSEILRVWSVLGEDGGPTLAGLLALGEHPQRFTPAARLRYRIQPSSSAPAGARAAGTHLEGTVGAILDQTIAQLRDDLEVYQVADSSGLVEDTDVPSEALREVVSNALIHRSFTPDLEGEPVTVEVSTSAVRIVSPGTLPVRVDPEKMGVHRFSGPRNLSLTRVCEELTTPSGHRIVESQGFGIRAADRVCRARDAAPPLFVDHHAQLEVLFLRGRLPMEEADDLLDETEAETGPCRRRLVAWAIRYERLLGELDPERIRAAELDEYLATRLCTPTPKEDVIAILTGLESDSVFQRAGGFPRTRWQLGPAASLPADVRGAMLSGDRVRDVLDAIVAAGGEAKREAIGDRMGLTSTRSTMKWINKARDKGLVEGTTESEFDPKRAYVLTETGSAVQERQPN